MRFLPQILFLLMLVPALGAAVPRINEFMARNDKTLADEDGEFPDWIEIYNPDGAPYDLSGCYLTDDDGDRTMWRFPAGTQIAAEGFLIVFASDKNRAVDGSELHTNFKLSSSAGNYLALVSSDGSTILDEITYPEQEEDVSFGTSRRVLPINLIEDLNPDILIPQAANELAANWFDASFVPDANWQEGTAPTAVGYDTTDAPSPLKNIALSGTASQSTSHNAGPANRGNDGNTGNFSHTAISDNNAWWQLTFSGDEEIHEFVLHNRDSCCQVRLRDVTIEIRDGGGAVLYTSPLLNAENALGDPELIEWDVAADNGSPVVGRSVRIRRTPDPDASGQGAPGGDADANVLALGEVFVMVPDPDAIGGEGERNLAPDGTASQSTTLSSFAATRAIDENLTNFTHTASSDQSPEWTLELANRSLLSEIVIHNRDNCCGQRLRDITVEVLDSDGSTTFLSDLLNPENVDGSPELLGLDLEGLAGGLVVGKTVKIRRTIDPDNSGQGGSGSTSDARVLSLGEVTVTGEPVFGFTTFINDDIEVDARGNNPSAFVRIPFEVANPSELEFLKLRLRYDDGFIAYLNGTQVATRNLATTPAWNSSSSTERDGAEAFQFEEIDISSALGSLNAGTNVLAIQMLNSSAGDDEFFLQPQLVTARTDVNDDVFLSTPTPGGSNNSEWYIDRVGPTQFSVVRGFHDNPFFVSLSSPTPGTEIRFTTDGNPPSESVGTIYTGPIEVTGTTVLRTIAYRDDYRSTDIETHTYIFRDDIITSSVMRTSVTEDPVYGPQMRDALTDLPTVALAFPGDIDREEKATSVELIGFSDGDIQVNAGMSRFGSYVTNFAKRNIRLAFRGEYGPKKLRYPLYDGHGGELRPVEVFDQLDLRTGSHDMVQRGFYMSNRFLDDTFIDMGYVNPHGRFIHLYINGTYWGMYHLRERWNADMHANYLGGEKEDYEAVASNRGGGAFSNATPYDGDGSAWANVVSLRDDYESLKDYMNMPQFVDFMLMLMSGNCEAEHRAVGPVGEGSGFLFYFNDGDGFTRNPPNRTGHAGPNNILSTLRVEDHPDFRTLVADRIQKHYFNGGLMTPGPATQRLLQRTTQIERAFLAEAARWNYRTPSSWENARDNYISNILSDLDETVIAMFEGAGLLPATAAPEFSQHGGEVADQYSLSLSTSTAGTIYFTTDGSDPRLSGGAIAADAASYSTAVTIDKNTFVRARTKNGNEWSGLTEAFFTVAGVDPLTADDIAISELHYHPADGTSNTEFLEILNTSDRPVNLRNTRFTVGVLYDFPTGRDLILNPGERIVLVKSLYHMNLAYGLGLPVAGIYDGQLDNDGELIRFEEMDGTEIAELVYNDAGAWPTPPDGSGVSLTLNEQFADFDESSPLFWRSSFVTGGTPGTVDSSGVTFPGGSDEDLLNYAYGNDGIREYSEPSFHMLSFGSDRHGVLTFRANMQTDDLVMHFKHSDNLIDWHSGPGETELLGKIDKADGTSQLTFRSLTPADAASPVKFLRIRFELR
ncbi:MAG: lamin tail domain-containing protein [Verrucomicrobiales bacterium]|nr:lamin tail domain-containing protein [Verrucomicrobiales bacterium]